MKPDLLRAQRIQQGWSQAKLAKKLGVHIRTVRRWELGETAPVPYHREQLLRLFDKTAKELGLCSNSDENESVEEAPTSTTQLLEPDVPDDVEESPSEMQTNPSYWQHAYKIPPLMDNIDKHGLSILRAQYNKSRLLWLMHFLSVITVLISLAFFQVPSPVVHKIIAIDDSIEGTGLNQFNYVGSGWKHCTNGCNGNGGNCYDGSWTMDNVAGDYMTVSFTGIQIQLYVVTGTYGGFGAISLDGGSETMVNFYSASLLGDQLIWASPTMPEGSHTFKLRVTGTKGDPSNKDSEVSIDRVDILS